MDYSCFFILAQRELLKYEHNIKFTYTNFNLFRLLMEVVDTLDSDLKQTQTYTTCTRLKPKPLSYIIYI